jgi:hypothetical protein
VWTVTTFVFSSVGSPFRFSALTDNERGGIIRFTYISPNTPSR